MPASTCVKELWLAISMHGRISRLQPFGNGISLLRYIVVHVICTYIVEPIYSFSSVCTFKLKPNFDPDEERLVTARTYVYVLDSLAWNCVQ